MDDTKIRMAAISKIISIDSVLKIILLIDDY